MHFVAAEHAKEWLQCTAGWGGTRKSVQAVVEGTTTWKESGTNLPSLIISLNIQNLGRVDAMGNGVVMKLAPLALYYSLIPDDEVSFQQKIEDVIVFPLFLPSLISEGSGKIFSFWASSNIHNLLSFCFLAFCLQVIQCKTNQLTGTGATKHN